VSGIRRWTLTTVSLWSIHTQTCTFQGWTYGFGLFSALGLRFANLKSAASHFGTIDPVERGMTEPGGGSSRHALLYQKLLEVYNIEQRGIVHRSIL
jgi:hypothetical protein